jgi:hypothetical protein
MGVGGGSVKTPGNGTGERRVGSRRGTEKSANQASFSSTVFGCQVGQASHRLSVQAAMFGNKSSVSERQ